MTPRPPRAKKTGLVRLALLTLALAAGATAAREQESLETAVKAAYLYKLAPFVDWPASSAPGAFAICVVGADPFGAVLDRAVAGQSVRGRPIVVRRLAVAARDMPCQIAYLGGSRTQGVRQALVVLRGAPVLTVTDATAAPGIVDFAMAEGRVRFRVDDQAAADNGLTISSKLLSLALSVRARSALGAAQ